MSGSGAGGGDADTLLAVVANAFASNASITTTFSASVDIFTKGFLIKSLKQ